FDAATFEIWGALLNGAELIGITKDIILSPRSFAEEIKNQGINILFLTPALFNQIVSEVPTAFQSIQYVVLGGDVIDPKAVKQVFKYGSPENLLNGYGPTENTTFSTWYSIQETLEEGKTIPIGRPISNTQTYILDNKLQLVPIGIPGELY
ncbi:AMP-binding protein, partial [Bacillus cereus]|uniref:AMP-binding protein n=2 Tax=Bacillus TaxID=1386 RepID=UPI00113AE97D